MCAAAPGRVNLIGEHTDYNDGFVLPAAIGYYSRVSVSRRDDRAVRVISGRFGTATISLDDRLPTWRGDWSDYARGIVLELRANGIALRGCDVHVSGDLPIGGGLGSSASFEVALALGLLRFAGATMAPAQIAQLCRRAETNYAGVRSGVMDQFAILLARAGYALFLDTRSLGFEHVPVPSGARILICNTMVRHRLTAGEYNRRREQCEVALEFVRRRNPPAVALRDVSPTELRDFELEMPAEIYRRARHVVSENDRVLAGVRALRANDLRAMGDLMYASHTSLRDDYEVSCRELDVMVEAARECEGVYGARMTGGGFGGCTINLLRAEAQSEFRRRVPEAYARATGIVPDIYDGTPVDGAAA